MRLHTHQVRIEGVWLALGQVWSQREDCPPPPKTPLSCKYLHCSLPCVPTSCRTPCTSLTTPFPLTTSTTPIDADFKAQHSTAVAALLHVYDEVDASIGYPLTSFSIGLIMTNHAIGMLETTRSDFKYIHVREIVKEREVR